VVIGVFNTQERKKEKKKERQSIDGVVGY